jgi:hypothetical protein
LQSPSTFAEATVDVLRKEEVFVSQPFSLMYVFTLSVTSEELLRSNTLFLLLTTISPSFRRVVIILLCVETFLLAISSSVSMASDASSTESCTCKLKLFISTKPESHDFWESIYPVEPVEL